MGNHQVYQLKEKIPNGGILKSKNACVLLFKMHSCSFRQIRVPSTTQAKIMEVLPT